MTADKEKLNKLSEDETPDADERMNELSIEELLNELDDVADKLENGDVPLEESFALYRKGMKLVTICDGKVEKIENQIEILDSDSFAADLADEKTSDGESV